MEITFFVSSILFELEKRLIYQTGVFLGRRIHFRGQIDNQERWRGGGRAVLPTPLFVTSISTPLFVTSILLELEEWLIYQTGGYLGRRIYFRGQIDNQESWEGGRGGAPHP